MSASELNNLLTVILNATIASNSNACILQISTLPAADFLHYIHAPSYLLALNDLRVPNTSGWDQCDIVLLYATHNPITIVDAYERYLRRRISVARHERKYIVHIDDGTTLDAFCSAPAMRFIVNMLVVLHTTHLYELYTHAYVGLDNVTVIRLSDNSSQSELWPDKLRDQHGRRLRIAAGHSLPMSEPQAMTGSELQLLREYARQHNATLDAAYRGGLFGIIFANGTMRGYLKLLFDDEVDVLAYGAYITPQYNIEYADYTYPYAMYRVFCIVPIPRLLSSWRAFAGIFSLVVWLCFALCYGAYAIHLLFLNHLRLHTTRNLFFVLTAVYLAQGVADRDLRGVRRFSIGALLAAMIVMQTLFISKVTSGFIAPSYTDDVRTLNDLAASDLYWYSIYDVARIIQREEQEPQRTVFNKYRRIAPEMSDSALDELFANGRSAFIVEEINHYYSYEYYITLARAQQHKPMTEPMYSMLTGIYLRRHSVLLPSLNALQHRAAAHGLITYWERHASQQPSDYKIQLHLTLSRDGGGNIGEFSALGMIHLECVFIMWKVCVALATAVFTVEVLLYQCL